MWLFSIFTTFFLFTSMDCLIISSTPAFYSSASGTSGIAHSPQWRYLCTHNSFITRKHGRWFINGFTQRENLHRERGILQTRTTIVSTLSIDLSELFIASVFAIHSVFGIVVFIVNSTVLKPSSNLSLLPFLFLFPSAIR